MSDAVPSKEKVAAQVGFWCGTVFGFVIGGLVTLMVIS
jgi:tetrahydromethanopterin S-methyltransferase subunit B